MAVITISRQVAALGDEISSVLAKKLNYKLMVLTKMVKYTNLNDLWRDLTARAHEGPLERSDIIEQSLEDWMANGKKVKVKVNN